MGGYKLIEFTEEVHRNQRSVDFVPSEWVSYDSQQGILVTRFMPPPFNSESCAWLHSLIQCFAPAPEDWPTYPINIRSEANTFEQATKKLKLLDKKQYAYSTDDDMNSKEKAKAASDKYKLKKPSKHLWNVPDFVADENCNKTKMLIL